jgi:hypothetical protein
VNGLAAAVVVVLSTPVGRRGDGPAGLLSGMFAAQGRPEWPHGVQEPDAPRFAVEHALELRPGHGDRIRAQTVPDVDEDELAGEIIELFNRPLASRG